MTTVESILGILNSINSNEKRVKIVEIIKAFQDGETVLMECGGGQWSEIKSEDDLIYYLQFGNEFKVKTEPKYRPYKSGKEYIEASKIHGPYIKYNSDDYLIPERIEDKCIKWCPMYAEDQLLSKSFEELMNDWTWGDGTPCGILE